jgi:hypothetical protein
VLVTGSVYLVGELLGALRDDLQDRQSDVRGSRR